MFGFRKRKSSIIELFESLYDPATGLWHAPGWFKEKFDPKQIEEYRLLPAHAAPIEREVADVYRSLIGLLKPTRILETGTNLGYSAYAIASALLKLGGERKLYTIDVREGHALFKGTEVEHLVTFIKGSSLDINLALLGDDPLDMLVLDSDHTYGTISGEVNRFVPLLRVGGIVLFHDTMFFDGIALVVQQLMQNPSFEVVNLPTPRRSATSPRCPGITIVRKIKEAQGTIVDRADTAMLSISVNLPSRTNLSKPLV